MIFFEWNQTLSVADPIIDDDHQTLIRLVNQFGVAASEKRDHSELEKTLLTLIEYTQTHFLREENLMASISYPKLKAHQDQHRKLMARVLDLKRELEEGRRSIAIETAELLRFWLTSHILLSDKELADAIKHASTGAK